MATDKYSEWLDAVDTYTPKREELFNTSGSLKGSMSTPTLTINGHFWDINELSFADVTMKDGLLTSLGLDEGDVGKAGVMPSIGADDGQHAEGRLPARVGRFNKCCYAIHSSHGLPTGDTPP